MTKLTVPPPARSRDELRHSINIRQVLSYLDHPVNPNSMACCPFHRDDTPSLWANDEFCWCYACGEGWDIFDLIGKTYTLDFVGALNWLRDHETELLAIPCDARTRRKVEYRGPVDSYIVRLWHKALKPEHYDYFQTKRGLTAETVDLHLLGWREDWKAYVLPFWRGIPQQSEVDIVQFRRTDDSPASFKDKFKGLLGHNRPSMINTHLLRCWGVLLFGTFDSLLAGQDGLPAVSPNGVTAFTSKSKADRLNSFFKDVKRLYVVKDSTPSEDKAVEQTVSLLRVPEVLIREFPAGQGKDYDDYRLVCGHTAAEFMGDVLGIGVY